MKKMSLLLIVTAMIVLVSCFAGKSKNKPVLLNGSQITKAQIATLQKAGLNTADSIYMLYSSGDLSKNAAFITKKFIAVLDSQKISGAEYTAIFDMLHSHSRDSLKESSITVYLRDNSEFVVKFAGNGSDDETFFNLLRDTWREID